MSAAQPIDPDELDGALERLLAISGRGDLATPMQIRSFKRFVEVCGLSWEGFRVGPVAAPRGLCLSLLLPGRTAVILLPQPETDHTGQRLALEASLTSLEPRQLNFAQTLVELENDGRRELLEETGFQYLAPLDYLERDVVYPWTDTPTDDAAEWVRYSNETHERFAHVLAGTYVDSADCPELAGLRTSDDALAAHRASGPFDPDLWELAHTASGDGGCLLLSRTVQPQVAEIVYVGVRPEWRGQGLGSLLIQRALERCRTLRQRRLTTVMDARNTAAQALYARFSFDTLCRRNAWLYRWSAAKRFQ